MIISVRDMAGNSTKAWEDMAVASLAVARWRCGPNPSLVSLSEWIADNVGLAGKF